MKTMDLSQATNRRKPRQTRSKERVSVILNVVRVLIEEKGINNLKVSDVAHRANTSPGSIYQYFKNKQSIIVALAEHYMEQIHSILDESLTQVDHIDALPAMLMKNFDYVYRLHAKEPALRQIWFEAIDPKLDQLAMQDCQINADKVYNKLLEISQPQNKAQLRKVILLMSIQFSSVMRLCFAQEGEDVTELRDIYVRSVDLAIRDYL